MITFDELRAIPLLANLAERTLHEVAVYAADVHLIQGE